MEIHLLDMGQTKYGDCLLLIRNNRTILIDGAHPGDSKSIASQLGDILQKDPPFTPDLLVVTHCHSDHIGCLLDLVSKNIVAPKMVLLADEKLGWGRSSGGDSPADALPKKQKALLYALQEEDHADLTDNELITFIQDAGNLEDGYIGMIETFEQNGIPVFRYGRDNCKPVEKEFTDFGLKILGPSDDHLAICAEALADSGDTFGGDFLSNIADAVDDSTLVNKYRQITNRLVQDAIGASDRPGAGAAKNNQSIVLKIQADGWTALLAGDMQLAKAEVKGLNDSMEELRQKIVNAGPYDFVKLTHHTSYNGFNESVLADYESTRLFAHTGGRKDASHPDDAALETLKANKSRLEFARTDRNGHITVKKKNNKLQMEISKGRMNTFTVNTVGDEELVVAPVKEEPTEIKTISRTEPDTNGTVEVITRIPPGVKKVTVTIEVNPADNDDTGALKKKLSNSPGDDGIFSVGNGRRLPKLLFVTSSVLLKRNIGETEAQKVIDAIGRNKDVDLLDINDSTPTVQKAAAKVRQKLTGNNYKGVVLIGGYDVVPSQQVDTIDQPLRDKLIELNLDREDADDFIVWSDDVYGDIEGDSFPELPVSRIPDGRSPSVLYGALSAVDFSGSDCFGIRNFARPFAGITYDGMPGDKAAINISETFGPMQIGNNSAKGAVYYMLHGSDRDATCFWGETADGDEFEAINLNKIPQSASGTIVFTGCCWGALPIFQRAVKAKNNVPLGVKAPEQSIAISYLKAGAQAFVGCTGSHYSPLQEPFDYYGKPMHDYFWQSISEGLRPAEALLNAKKKYAAGIPHSKKDSFSRAIELKIFNQFTCLGLGW